MLLSVLGDLHVLLCSLNLHVLGDMVLTFLDHVLVSLLGHVFSDLLSVLWCWLAEEGIS